MNRAELLAFRQQLSERIERLEKIVAVLKRMMNCRTFAELAACEAELEKLQEP